MKKIALLVALTLIAACGDSQADPTTTTTSTTVAAESTTSTTTTTTSTTTTTTTTTTTSTTTTTTTTTTTPPPEFGFFMDGLGVVDFGAKPTKVLDALDALFGAPVIDTGWLNEPLCPGPQYRGMFWGDDRQLWLMFTTGDLYRNDGVGHFFSYNYKGGIPVPVEPPALTVGTTVAQLQALYPSVQIVPNPYFAGQYDYRVDGDTDLDRLSGNLSGNGAGDVVLSVKGGIGCGE